jgi:hypothetical protein
MRIDIAMQHGGMPVASLVSKAVQSGGARETRSACRLSRGTTAGMSLISRDIILNHIKSSLQPVADRFAVCA